VPAGKQQLPRLLPQEPSTARSMRGLGGACRRRIQYQHALQKTVVFCMGTTTQNDPCFVGIFVIGLPERFLYSDSQPRQSNHPMTVPATSEAASLIASTTLSTASCAVS
jgi:hypothetical protein